MCIFIALTSLINFSGVKLFGLLVAIPFFIGAGFGKGGAGDGFLVAASSLVLGLTVGLQGICLGLACFCLYYLVRKGIQKSPMPKSFPLAPFLSIGFIAAYLIGG